jgi:hypothetical protein
MKSHVSLEAHVCPVCGKKHQTNSILLDKRLRASMEKETVTGYGMCGPCEELNKRGYIALVEVDNKGTGDTMKMENANRTGRIAHLRRTVFNQIFNTTVSATLPMVFVDSEVISKITAMQAPAADAE